MVAIEYHAAGLVGKRPVRAFHFPIKVRGISTSSGKAKLLFIADISTKTGRASKGAIFINSDSQEETLMTKVSEKPTEGVNGWILIGGAEQSQHAGIGVNNDEDSSESTNGFNVPECKVHM
jgi:hypothetical protein